MSDEGRLFLEACGVAGPLRFEWADPTMAEVRSRDIEQAAFVVGRDPAADLVLDDPAAEPYQALFQVVDGRLFAIDLGSGPGLRWGEIPRQAGWVNRGQLLRIGGSTVRFLGGDRDGAESIIEPAPISSRYVSRLNLPGVVLEFRTTARAEGGWHKQEALDRVLVLAGSSERCKLRAVGRRVARFTCALIRTPKGLWMTNIVPGAGATVNGALCRFARLEDKDIIQIGPFGIRVIYTDPVKAPLVQAPYSQVNAVLGPAVQPRPLGQTSLSLDESPPEILLQSLLEQEGREPGVMASPFGQALVLMVRLLGDVHRDHLALVRNELAEIRRLSRDMDRLRTEMQPPALRSLSLPQDDPIPGMSHPVGLDSPLEPEVVPRPGPEAVREIIGERLEAWERERQSRWRKVLKLLTGS
ncbi:MAG: FHA domain-containing protein [Isosphaeraceae bacterium]